MTAGSNHSPGDPPTLEARAIALERSGRPDEAAAAYLEALRADRTRIACHLGLARLFLAKGDFPVAEAAFREALRIDPDHPEAVEGLGLVLALAHAGLAEPFLRRAWANGQGRPEVGRMLAFALRRTGRHREARDLSLRLLEKDAFDLESRVASELVLPAVARSAGELDAARRDFASGLSRLKASAPTIPLAPDRLADFHAEHFLLAYQGGDDLSMQRDWGDFVDTLLGRAGLGWTQPAMPSAAKAGARLRVGFVSGFLRDCTIGRYFGNWIEDLDEGAFETFAYHLGPTADATTSRLASRCRLVHVPTGARDAARAIAADGPDLLVYPDVGMHTTANLLAAMRLAPIQVAAWGHPVTTGLKSIDAFVTCEAMEPPGAVSHYREVLVALPGIGVRYRRPGPVPRLPRADLGLPAKGNLYLCPQSAFKIHPDSDALFAGVLSADPEGWLVLFSDHEASLTAAIRDRLVHALAASGVDPSRVAFLPRCSRDRYLATNAACDVFLDTPHWSGGSTSLDALAAGLPVVTMPGAYMRGRQSLAMLRMAGVPELVAGDGSEYVRLAVRLATDRAWRARIAERLEAGLGALFDRSEPVRALERHLLELAGRH